jgi:hypothetical protein
MRHVACIGAYIILFQKPLEDETTRDALAY